MGTCAGHSAMVKTESLMLMMNIGSALRAGEKDREGEDGND